MSHNRASLVNHANRVERDTITSTEVRDGAVEAAIAIKREGANIAATAIVSIESLSMRRSWMLLQSL